MVTFTIVGGISVDYQWYINWLSYNLMCHRVFLKAFSVLKASGMGDRKCYGPYNLTTSTSIFVIIPFHHVTQKKGILFGDERRWPHPISDIDGRIYCLADPFQFSSKLKIWSFQVILMQRKFKKGWCMCRVVVLLIKPITFSRCRHHHSFVRSIWFFFPRDPITKVVKMSFFNFPENSYSVKTCETHEWPTTVKVAEHSFARGQR